MPRLEHARGVALAHPHAALVDPDRGAPSVDLDREDGAEHLDLELGSREREPRVGAERSHVAEQRSALDAYATLRAQGLDGVDGTRARDETVPGGQLGSRGLRLRGDGSESSLEGRRWLLWPVEDRERRGRRDRHRRVNRPTRQRRAEREAHFGRLFGRGVERSLHHLEGTLS